MIALISLSLIIPFLMILSAQKRNYETELDRILTNCDHDVSMARTEETRLEHKCNSLNHQNFELKAKLEIQELKVMRSCRNWSRITQLKCAINPTGSCLECHDYEVLGK